MTQERNVLHEILGTPRRPPRGGGSHGGPGGRQIGLALVILLILVAAYTSIYTVQPEERAVVKRFGAVRGITDPGLHFKLPLGIDAVQKVATERVLKQEFGFRTVDLSGDRTRYSDEGYLDESLMLSGDLNMIQVEWVVQYRISDPIKFLYAMREPTQTLRDLSESVMRRVVGNRVGSKVLTTARVDIANDARQEIQEAMDHFDNGLHIITVQLQDVVPPARVQPAFNEVNEARQELERMVNEANRQVNEAIPKAQGAANRTIAEAEGYATERVNHALGETARFKAVLAEYRNAPEVTRSRLYIETLRDVLPRIGSVVVMREGQLLPLMNFENANVQKLTAAEDEE
ncbi:MAG TPA: FtsH protease activity modulator HflK [Woeseiaceae bacterium]|jgi:membrane protease subunit HflK|nr:FtsH protease activity modulator HflK [Woeseiaceae bacterium]